MSTPATVQGGTTTGAAATAAAASGPANVVRGALICFEGLDRSGKSTQVTLLEKRFTELGRPVRVMRFPDRSTPIGKMIDSYLKSSVDMDDHVIHLLFSANRWEAAKQIKSLLAGGTTVLCDRYYYSGMVYSAAKHNPSLSLSWARTPEVGLPRPDAVLFLDLEQAAAQARGGWGDEKYERAEMQARVKEIFWSLSLGRAGEFGEAGAFRQEEEDLVLVDASPAVEAVADKVWEVVRPRVEAVERGEVGRTVRIVQ